MARRHSGIRCSRFAFVREAGMVQTPWFRSISVHAAPRALAGACRCQHQELEGQLHDRARVRCPNVMPLMATTDTFQPASL